MNDVLDRRAAPEQFVQREQPLRCRDDRTVPEPLEVDVHELRVASEREPGATLFEGANGLLERFGEVSTNGHHLAYRLHLVPSSAVAPGNFSKAQRGIFVTT